MSCVTSLTTDIAPGCEGLKRPGGVNKKIYAGSVKDISSIGYDETDGHITSIEMKSGKEIIAITGRMRKHSADEVIQAEGEGNVILFQHEVRPVVYHSTQAERNALEELIQLDQSFFLIPTNSKQVLAYGLPKENEPIEEYGLQPSEGSDPLGTELNDQVAQTLTFTGQLLSKALITDLGGGGGAAEGYRANITAIELLLEPAV